MSKRYLAYIRVSTAKQGTHGSSLEEQRLAIERYAERHGLLIIEWFEERETAAKRGRSAFGRVLKSLEAGDAQGVIIHKIDRSARNLRDWADLADLIDRGADVHFAHDALDLRSRGGRLSADIQAVVAADFIRNLRDETRKGLYGRLRQGIYPFRAPLGYLDTGGGKLKEIDPVRGPLIQQAFALYATGEYGYNELKAEMHRRGLRGHNDRAISLNGYSSILNNPFYYGLIHLRKSGEVFDGAHPPLISKALYDQVQATLLAQRGGKATKQAFLFRRLVRCASCNYCLIGERQKGKYSYYRCHTSSCRGTIVREQELHACVEKKVALLRFDEDEMREFRLLIEDEKRKVIFDDQGREAAIRLRLAQCGERLDRLTDALLDGIIGRDVHDERRRRLLDEKRDLRDQLNSPQPSVASLLEEELELACTAYSQYISGILLEGQKALQSITSNFSVSGKTPTITLKSPLQEFVNWRESAECDLTQGAPRTRAVAIFEIFRAAIVKRSECPRSPQVPGAVIDDGAPSHSGAWM